MDRFTRLPAAGVLVALAALTVAGPATAEGPAAPPVIPLSASFISAAAGWLLALPACAPHGCTRLLLRKTTDGGRTWVSMAPPPAHPSTFPSTAFMGTRRRAAGTVNTLLFVTPADGWLYGPGLWATHDGGASWRRISTRGQIVTRMGTGAGRVFAVFQPARCGANSGTCSYLYASPVGADAFRRLAGTRDVDGPATNIVVTHGHAYAGAFYGWGASGTPRQALLTGPAAGGGRWHALKLPRRRGHWGGCGDFGMFLATAGSQLLLGCAGQPAAGVPAPMQHKWLSLSRDGGRSWRQLTSPPTFAGYMTDVSLAPGGPLAESGSDADPRFSWDGGRSWHTSPGLRAAYDASAGTGLAVTMVTHAFGFALDGYLYYPRIFLTRDSGHAWSAETVR